MANYITGIIKEARLRHPKGMRFTLSGRNSPRTMVVSIGRHSLRSRIRSEDLTGVLKYRGDGFAITKNFDNLVLASVHSYLCPKQKLSFKTSCS